MISPNDISVVIQGAIDEKITRLTIKSILKHLNGAEIIISTWENSDCTNLYCDKVIYNEDPGAVSSLPFTPKPNNINRQIVSTKNGIEQASRKYILKLRTDCILKSNKFLKYHSILKNYNLRDPKYAIFKDRIMIDSYFTRNPEYNEKIAYPYHPSDIWLFGLKEDLLNLFSIPLLESNTTTYNKKDYLKRLPEQHLWTSFLERNSINHQLDYAIKKSPSLTTVSNTYLINNFYVLNHNISGIKFPDKIYNYPLRIFSCILTSKRWFELYNIQNNLNNKIPIKFKYQNVFEALGFEKYYQKLVNTPKKLQYFLPIIFNFIKICLKAITNLHKYILWKIY